MTGLTTFNASGHREVSKGKLKNTGSYSLEWRPPTRLAARLDAIESAATLLGPFCTRTAGPCTPCQTSTIGKNACSTHRHSLTHRHANIQLFVAPATSAVASFDNVLEGDKVVVKFVARVHPRYFPNITRRCADEGENDTLFVILEELHLSTR